MKITQYLAAFFALAGSSVAGPVKRQYPSGNIDGAILNYALTLEHLEDKFYRDGLAMFSKKDFMAAGLDETFYENLKEISYDETTHVSFLTSALQAAGVTPVAECTYAFGVTSVETFLATASVLEGVGVSAYLGAASAITSDAYLTAAGSILTVEARHSAYLRAAGLGERPFPQAFDVPLDFNEVYSLAAPFIVSCPSTNPTFLPLKAFPALTVMSKGPILTGSHIMVSTEAKYDGDVYAAFVTVTGPVFAPISQNDKGECWVTVPAGVHGQSYLLFTKDAKMVTDDTIVAGPAIVEIAGTDGMPGSP